MASAAVNIGTLVSIDTTRPTGYDTRGPTLVENPTTSGAVTGNLVYGVVVRPDNRQDQSALAIGEVFDVLSRGRIWVQAEEAVAVGDPVFARYAAGGNGIGALGMQAGTSERSQVAGARWLSAASANGLAMVEIQG